MNVNAGGGLINHIAVKDDNFIETIEYNIDVFKSISEDNIIKLIEELKMQD